ncbi:hypothetical protein ACI6Q2_17050 [Chitinophagaceae bacterium LWZ2-11]
MSYITERIFTLPVYCLPYINESERACMLDIPPEGGKGSYELWIISDG